MVRFFALPDRSVHIVETTLRDGTYEVDFQFTPEDTAFFASRLDRAGLEYIEVCHGVGFGTDMWTHPPKLVRAAASDLAHLEAAASVLERAKLGVIMVVGEGFTAPSALATLKRLGVHFVRLAYLPDNINDPYALAYIDEAKKQGLLVSINLMQTYALSPKQVAEVAKCTAQRGADWFYFVDSAGAMTTAEITGYTRALVEASPMRVGLHAHNNTAMAMASCLAAVDAGATLLDSTLQGIGRATGNPSTEQLLLALQRRGHETHIDRDAVLTLGELARPLFAERGTDPTHFISGSARLHSRYLGPLAREAAARKVAAREFIYQVGQIARGRDLWNGEAFPADLFDAAVGTMRAAEPHRPAPAMESVLAQGLARVSQPELGAVCADLFTRAHKNRKRSVLCLVSSSSFPFAGPLPWDTGDLCGTALPIDQATLDRATVGDRPPHYILHDAVLSPPASWLPTVPRLVMPFSAIVAEATVTLVAALLAKKSHGVVLTDLGDARISSLVSTRLDERGIAIGSTRASGLPALWLGRHDGAWPSIEPADTVVIVVGGRSPAIDRARSTGVRVLRPALTAALAGFATAQCQTVDRLALNTIATPGVVDSLIAAASDEIVADESQSPNHIVDAGPSGINRAAGTLAPLRAAGLNAGRGKI